MSSRPWRICNCNVNFKKEIVSALGLALPDFLSGLDTSPILVYATGSSSLVLRLTVCDKILDHPYTLPLGKH